jgi:hypothetical protein
MNDDQARARALELLQQVGITDGERRLGWRMIFSSFGVVAAVACGAKMLAMACPARVTSLGVRLPPPERRATEVRGTWGSKCNYL